MPGKKLQRPRVRESTHREGADPASKSPLVAQEYRERFPGHEVATAPTGDQIALILKAAETSLKVCHRFAMRRFLARALSKDVKPLLGHGRRENPVSRQLDTMHNEHPSLAWWHQQEYLHVGTIDQVVIPRPHDEMAAMLPLVDELGFALASASRGVSTDTGDDGL